MLKRKTDVMKYLSLQDIHKAFGKRQVLQGVDLCLKPGRCYMLTGPNGAGKSTLLRICAGLEKPDRCRVDIGNGVSLWKRNRNTLRTQSVYLHQQPYMFDGNVIQNLAYALRKHKDKSLNEERINMALHWAGLDGPVVHSWAKSLSGGERQRVALARAWLCSPKIMLLDEPTNNLDEKAKKRTIAMLMSLKAQGITLLIASHETEHFETIADELLEIVDGKLVSLTMTPTSGVNVIPREKITRAVSA